MDFCGELDRPAEYPFAMSSMPGARLPAISARARARLAYAAMFAAVAAQAPYFVLVYRDRGLDLSAIGWVVGLGALVALLSSPLWGALSDRVRGEPRLILAPTGVALSGAALLFALPSKPSVDLAGGIAVVLGCALVTSGFAGIGPIIEARGLETSGHDRSGYGPLRAFGSLAFIVWTIPTGIVVERFGPSAALVSYVSMILLTAGIGLSLVPASRSEDLARTQAPGLAEVRRLLATPRLGLFLVGAALAWICVAGVVNFYALRFAELNGSPSMTGLAFSLGAAVEIPVMTSFPWLARRVGGERLVIIGALFLALRAFVSGIAASPDLVVAVSALGGLGFALTLVGGVTFVSRLAPAELQATAQGVFQGSTNSVGAIAGGLLAAVLGAIGINVGGLFVLVAGIGVAAAAVFVLVLEPGTSRAGGPSAPAPPAAPAETAASP
jgi:MFS transporter, PPP family, 3-phenylpropionic acid transporter